jgi:Ca2+-dependent lipid-binding protein
MRTKIGATQIAFINLPTLNLDFVGAADIADFSLIKGTIHGVLMDVIASMLVLPNRLMIKLDAANDYFKTYQHHLGVLRLTIEQATGIKGERSGKMGRLLDKVMKDIPDCYCKVNVGAEKDIWRTKVLKNTIDPVWNETHDFLVMDHDQAVSIDVLDKDLAGDDNLGIAMTPVKQLLLSNNGTEELTLVKGGKSTDVKLKVKAQWLEFVPNKTSFSGAEAEAEEKAVSGRIAGLVTVLVANVHGLTGDKTKLHPSVKVQWGAKHEFQTAVMSYSAGVDIFNPGFDTAFRIPINAADLAGTPASFKITLMNAKTESGSVEVPFADVLAAPNMTKEDVFKVGSDGATVKASIWVRGTELSK